MRHQILSISGNDTRLSRKPLTAAGVTGARCLRAGEGCEPALFALSQVVWSEKKMILHAETTPSFKARKI